MGDIVGGKNNICRFSFAHEIVSEWNRLLGMKKRAGRDRPLVLSFPGSRHTHYRIEKGCIVDNTAGKIVIWKFADCTKNVWVANNIQDVANAFWDQRASRNKLTLEEQFALNNIVRLR